MNETPQELIALSAASKVTTFMDPTIWGQMKAMAETLRQSGMLPRGLDTVPKILVVMQTGFENGLKPMEAFGSLYVVNGAVNYYGKAVTRRFREHGWKITYKDENEGSVTAVVTNAKDPKEIYEETYTFAEAQKSGYTLDNTGKLKFGWKEGFNRRLKLRYGALSLIIKSYVPEILGSARGIVEVEEDVKYDEEIKTVDSPTTPATSEEKANALDAFMKKAKQNDIKNVKPVHTPSPQKSSSIFIPSKQDSNSDVIEGEVVSEGESFIADMVADDMVNAERSKLEKRYFALLKEVGSDHETAKSLFQFEHLKDLTEQELIDIVGQLSKNVAKNKAK